MKTVTLSMCMGVMVEIPNDFDEDTLLDDWDTTDDGQIIFNEGDFKSYKCDMVEGFVVEVEEDNDSL